MKNHQIPSLVLVLLLQVAPLSRLAMPNPAVATTGFAILLRWVAGAGAMLGAADAVSGASAAISGLQLYINGVKTNGVTFAPNVPAGLTNIMLRIIVANPGSDHAQDYWNCTPLPPNLSLNTNVGGNGFITNLVGQPTIAGVYPVTLLAGNLNYGSITTNATITVVATGGTAPAITTQPVSLTVTNGDPASFTVVATGSPAPTYQWRKGGVVLTGKTNSTYAISSVSTNDVGSYDVVVSNSAGSVTSSPASLAVVVPAAVPPTLASVTLNNGHPTFTITGSPNQSYVVWSSADLHTWSAVQTNSSATGTIQFTDTGSLVGTALFYQASQSP